MFLRKESLAYIGASLCIAPFLEGWKAALPLALALSHALLERSFRERKRLEAERARLPINLLLFAFLCRLGLPLPRVLRFMKETFAGELTSSVVRNALHYIYMGRDISAAFDEMRGAEREIGRTLLEIWSMGKTEHPFTILRTAGKEHKKSLLVRAESLESKKAISKAVAFFLPILLTPLVSPNFAIWDAAFTALLALVVYRILSYITGW